MMLPRVVCRCAVAVVLGALAVFGAPRLQGQPPPRACEPRGCGDGGAPGGTRVPWPAPAPAGPAPRAGVTARRPGYPGYSVAQLYHWRERVRAGPRPPRATMWYVDEARRRLVVGFPDSTDFGPGRRALRRLGIPRRAVEIIVAGEVQDLERPTPAGAAAERGVAADAVRGAGGSAALGGIVRGHPLRGRSRDARVVARRRPGLRRWGDPRLRARPARRDPGGRGGRAVGRRPHRTRGLTWRRSWRVREASAARPRRPSRATPLAPSGLAAEPGR